MAFVMLSLFPVVGLLIDFVPNSGGFLSKLLYSRLNEIVILVVF